MSVPAGHYLGRDGKRYHVFGDGTVYEVTLRYKFVSEGGQRKRIAYPGTYRRVGTARAQELKHALESAERHAPHEESEKPEGQAPVVEGGERRAG